MDVQEKLQQRIWKYTMCAILCGLNVYALSSPWLAALLRFYCNTVWLRHSCASQEGPAIFYGGAVQRSETKAEPIPQHTTTAGFPGHSSDHWECVQSHHSTTGQGDSFYYCYHHSKPSVNWIESDWTGIGCVGRGEGYSTDRGWARLSGVGKWLIYMEIWVDLNSSSWK